MTTPALVQTKFNFSFPLNTSSHPLQVDHAIPELFFKAEYTNENPGKEIERLFSSTVQSITTRHEKTLLERCGSSCYTCQKPAHTVVPAPTHISNDGEKAAVQISVYPLCGLETCKQRAHTKIVEEELERVMRGAVSGPQGPS